MKFDAEKFKKKLQKPFYLQGEVYRQKAVGKDFNFIETAKKFHKSSEKWKSWPKTQVKMEDGKYGYSFYYAIYFEGKETEIATMQIDGDTIFYREIVDMPRILIDLSVPPDKRPKVLREIDW